ncbi:MAG: hypothetical protein OEQ39_16255 [Gammaproteobacteria bacterium]|nr:hypothetical protein [Gammaproteobacteria bacterium]MDH3378494.1 hypothetical protein [Gammaproteobacteria bacterium]
MNDKLTKLLFIVAGLYDGILGIAFIFFPLAIFETYMVEPPNHIAYVQFPAMLLMVFAAMFFQIARDPVKNRGLILYGCGLKISYCSMVFWYQATSIIPDMWIPWAWIDLVFLLLFILAYRNLEMQARRSGTA